MTRELSKLGGACGLVVAGTCAIGLVMYATVLIDYTLGGSPHALVDHRLSLYVWSLIITIVFGIVLVLLVLALRDAVRDRNALVDK
jgi:tetrahydromethanopterin S-methyltransferase subunit D